MPSESTKCLTPEQIAEIRASLLSEPEIDLALAEVWFACKFRVPLETVRRHCSARPPLRSALARSRQLPLLEVVHAGTKRGPSAGSGRGAA